MSDELLRVEHLGIAFQNEKSAVSVVEDVNFTIGQGEIVGIVGESGCGKSISALSLVKLNAPNAVYAPESRVMLGDRNVLALEGRALRDVRGREIAVIFQDSLTGLDPVMPLKKIMVEVVRSHRRVSRGQALQESVEMLRRVGIPAPEQRINEYAHQLSGGMRQRVMIALAMLHHSRLLIADEPTTALDVTIQDHILELIKRVRRETGMSVLIITHDMGVVAELTDRIYVMYSGRIVEAGPRREIFENPLHPYTRGLLQSIPRLDQPAEQRLYTIPGMVPAPGSITQGCRFCNRCESACDRCQSSEPPMLAIGDRQVRCWKYENA